MHGLYAIVDTQSLAARGWDPSEFTRALLDAGVRLLQLRAKNQTSKQTLSLLRELVPLARAAGATFFGNDRPDLAFLGGADGVHLGQEDVPLEVARRVRSDWRVGLSTHNEAQLRIALSKQPSYVAVGPIFDTASKQNPDPVLGLDELRRLVQIAKSEAPPIPVIGIGGITEASIADVVRAGAIPAVISELMPARFEDVRKRAARLIALAEAAR